MHATFRIRVYTEVHIWQIFNVACAEGNLHAFKLLKPSANIKRDNLKIIKLDGVKSHCGLLWHSQR
jgi:hypothetical protein